MVSLNSIKTTILLFVCLVSLKTQAQSPEGINYQAVIMDNGGDPIPNREMYFKIQLLQGNTNVDPTYSESFIISTSGNGVVNFIIGNGNVIEGDFASIDWSNGPYWLKLFVDYDASGTSSVYEEYGAQQLMSVPYALHAK